jgi:hypothetical protein
MKQPNSVVDHFPIVQTAQVFSRRSILPTGNLATCVLARDDVVRGEAHPMPERHQPLLRNTVSPISAWTTY